MKYNYLISFSGIFNSILNWLKSLLNLALDLISKVLPDSPFTQFLTAFSDNKILGMANYFLPINEILVISEAWVTCVGIYYLYALIMRWAKAIE